MRIFIKVGVHRHRLLRRCTVEREKKQARRKYDIKGRDTGRKSIREKRP